MWGDYGYFEGDKLGKPYDLKLLGRMLRYLRPYLGPLALTSLLILGATAADLIPPYLTKMAIDRYIVISAQKVRAAPEIKSLIDRNYEFFQPTGRPGTLFLFSSRAKMMEPRDLAGLKAFGALEPEPYYVVEASNAQAMETVKARPDLFEVFPEVAAVPEKDLGRLGRAELDRLRSGDSAGLAWIALTALLVVLLGYVLDFVQVILLEYTGQRVTHDLRQDLLSHVLRQPLAFHDHTATGRLVARVTNDIQNLGEMIRSVSETFFKDAFILAGIVIILLNINSRLALLTFALLPPIVLATMIFRRLARDIFRDLRSKVSRINSIFSETISGVRIVQAFRREALNLKKFSVLNHENYLAGMRQIKVFGLFMPLIEVIASVALGLVIWYGGLGVINETMTLGAVAAFIGYVRKFFQPIRDVAEKYNILQSAMASLERIFNLMDQDFTLAQPDRPRAVPPGPGEIEFKDVSFEYNPGDPVLRNVSFRIEPGSTLAIVGATGAGKTSIINLLLRFYDPSAGRVLVDGVDVRELDLAAHRSRIGLVMQDVFLFAGTIRENITLAEKGLSLEKIKAAARDAGAARFIEALPDGYEQPLGEGGLSLSTGQRQLLAFSRVLIQAPQILVLDEATASIDSETEKLIEEALGKLTAGRTSVVIAHRLSTIRRADAILVMHQGRVCEMGTHAELIARQGLFYQLHHLQFQESVLSNQDKGEKG
ncbi:MAG: ABC transporter ATP-binding protein [Pseudomonadota bacterium]